MAIHLPGSTTCASAISRKVLYIPPLKAMVNRLRSISPPSVRIFRLAPKEAEPLVLVPTPRCTSTCDRDELISVMFTQNTPWLSPSFSGTSFTVMLILVWSVPRMRK